MNSFSFDCPWSLLKSSSAALLQEILFFQCQPFLCWTSRKIYEIFYNTFFLENFNPLIENECYFPLETSLVYHNIVEQIVKKARIKKGLSFLFFSWLFEFHCPIHFTLIRILIFRYSINSVFLRLTLLQLFTKKISSSFPSMSALLGRYVFSLESVKGSSTSFSIIAELLGS